MIFRIKHYLWRKFHGHEYEQFINESERNDYVD